MTNREKERSGSLIDVSSKKSTSGTNESFTKEKIISQIIQNKEELSKKQQQSKSVENLVVNIQGMNQRRAMINQIASKMMKSRDGSKNPQTKLDSFRQPQAKVMPFNESSILKSSESTY